LKNSEYIKTGYPVNNRMVKTATGVAIIEIVIIGNPGCGFGYELITATATGCTPLI
jgi:hypothetical protein